MGAPLVYVHGAGPQDPPATLKHTLDGLLFGHDVATTRVAHYATIRWRPDGGKLPVGGESRRRQAIRAAAAPGVSPRAAARAIVAASLTSPSPPGGGRGRGVAPEPAAGTTAKPAPLPPEAVQLVERLYRRADRIALRSPGPRTGTTLALTFPNWGFRLVVGRFASDVIDYLFGGWAERMRAPVRKALLDGPAPKVIVAHSLGTIILYDVLNEPALAGFHGVDLITAGCPLGIGNVQDRLRDGAGRPNPVPKALAHWTNFADRFDPVALEATLRDEFNPPPNFAVDDSVNNPARNNHDLTGYLSVPIVQSVIVAALGP